MKSRNRLISAWFRRESYTFFFFLRLTVFFFFLCWTSVLCICVSSGSTSSFLGKVALTSIDYPFFSYPQTLRVATPLTLDANRIGKQQSIGKQKLPSPSGFQRLNSCTLDLSSQSCLCRISFFFFFTYSEQIKAVLGSCSRSCCCLWQQCAEVIAK